MSDQKNLIFDGIPFGKSLKTLSPNASFPNVGMPFKLSARAISFYSELFFFPLVDL
jgi:hypothetical protein